MTLSSEPLIFFGTDTFSLPSFEALIASGYTITAVVTKPDAPVGRGRQLISPPVAVTARQYNIPILQPSRSDEIVEMIRPYNINRGVVVAYGRILPPAVLQLFSEGLINVHPSLLPKYRGPAPIEAAILNGDSVTGISLMQLDQGMDTGPIYVQVSTALTGLETRISLYETLSKQGGELLALNLTNIFHGTIPYRNQSELGSASTTHMIHKTDGLIDWIKPADYLARQVRAYLGWPGSRARLDDHDVTITSAHASNSRPLMGTGETGGRPGTAYKTVHGELAVITGHGELIIDYIKPAGKGEMSGRAYIAGHKL